MKIILKGREESSQGEQETAMSKVVLEVVQHRASSFSLCVHECALIHAILWTIIIVKNEVKLETASF